jgi:hypothetical protein
MKPRRVKTAPGFDKALRDLPPNLRGQTIEAVKRFIDRAAERSLQPERKTGLQGIWAFRVTSGVRVFYVQRRTPKAPTANCSMSARTTTIGP